MLLSLLPELMTAGENDPEVVGHRLRVVRPLPLRSVSGSKGYVERLFKDARYVLSKENVGIHEDPFPHEARVMGNPPNPHRHVAGNADDFGAFELLNAVAGELV